MTLNMLSLRFDRLATLYFFYPLRKKKNPSRGVHIPILMYHSISNNNLNTIHPYYQTNTSPAAFSDQIKYLYENNYTVIPLDDIERYLTSTGSILQENDKKYVVITFDDGFRDFYKEAFPVLQKYSFTATVFLPTSFIGEKRSKFKEIECLNWGEVRELYSRNIFFGSHTVNHPELRHLKKVEIEDELQKSKEIIEDKLGSRIKSFSYPFAFPEEDKDFVIYLKSVLLKCGYKNGVSTIIGTTHTQDDILFLTRVPVNSSDDMFLFKAKLNGGYDWLHNLQYLFKYLKNRRVVSR